MLPSYGAKAHAGFGGRRRDGKGVALLAALLGLGVLLSSWSWSASRHRVSSLNHDLAKLREQHSVRQNRRYEEMSKTRNVENQHHVMNRQLQEASRSLQSAEQRLLEAATKQDAMDKDCQRQLDDLADRLGYETQVGTALKRHIDGMEGAHRNREADWHHLAEKWKSFEVTAIEENQRLLIENARLQNKEVPKDFLKPLLPSEEPQDRPEAHFDAEFHKPEFLAPVHVHEHKEQHHSGAAHEAHLDPKDQPWSDQGFAQTHDTWQGDDWHAPGPSHRELKHDAWKDSYGVQHDSWQDVHGLHHDEWQDSHGVHHDSWQDSQGLQHDDWLDSQGMHHDSWQDSHGVHHETWQDLQGKIYDDWEDAHGMHHDDVKYAEGQYSRWQAHHDQHHNNDPPTHGRHENAWQEEQRAQVPSHRANPSDAHGSRDWEHGAAHGGAGHGGSGHGVPAWHGGSHEHGHANERPQDEGRAPWRNPRS